MNAEEFNALYPVGTPVFAYPGARPEDYPKATRLVAKTRSRASVLGGHTDVVWVDGHSACIALTHVDVVTGAEYEAALLEDAVEREGALPMPVPVGPQASERDRLRAAFVEALDNAHHTHPCPEYGKPYWTGCVHYDETGRVSGVGSCHNERRADAVLVVRDAEVESLRARVAELEAERAKYVGKEPTIAEEMAYLSRCVNAVDAFCHEMSRQGIVSGGPFTVAAVRRLIEGGGLSAGGLFLADVDGADPTLWRSEAAARAHCVAVLGSELEGRAYGWAPVEGGVSQVRFVDEPGWGAARVWPLTVSSAADEDECTCPETDRVEPHWSGCPEEDAPCPVDGPLPGVGTGAGAPEMRALRAALYGPPDGEHYAQVHHAYRLGHDLPETGGTQ